MANNKHLSFSDRCFIEKSLYEGTSFKQIARILNKDCSTISKEVRKHSFESKKTYPGKVFNDCEKRGKCDRLLLCSSPSCNKKQCRFCSLCIQYCKEYVKISCPKLEKPPYVCNGCEKLRVCCLLKKFYDAKKAHEKYSYLKSESRKGINITEDEIKDLDQFLSPLLLQGQSIHNICVNNIDEVMFSEKTLYKYVNLNLFKAGNIDLPRVVRFKPRTKKEDSFKVDKACRVGRTYDDFNKYLNDHPDCSIVEMDSVIGNKGGKVLLTIHFVKTEFMIGFLRDRNTSASVTAAFEYLYSVLKPESFKKLFPVILGDNGSEFSNPLAIENDLQGNPRTKVFYCDPSSPYQKGAIENNHEFIRRILPKSTSFNNLTQEKINLMFNHINSYSRSNLGDRSPYEIFSLFYGKEVLDLLGCSLIPPNDIILKPELLK